jgi:L-ribulose-5-phosphate 3-epimerase
VRIRPSIRLSALPRCRPLDARLAMARAAGFEGLELEAHEAPAPALRAAADRAGLVVHGVHCNANRSLPLTSADPKIRDAGIAATLAALDAAHVMGADSLLLLPGVVGADASSAAVFERSQAVIRAEILPAADRLGITLAIENVWNGFLLSPYDCARYVDAFASPRVKLYLDVGNVIFGRPEGWIDIIGDRIGKLHLKDLIFWPDQDRFRKARVGEGAIDWAAVRRALRRTGFAGWAVMAEAETIQPRPARLAFQGARWLAARLGDNPAFAAVETILSRRLLADSMDRFCRYVARAD